MGCRYNQPNRLSDSTLIVTFDFKNPDYLPIFQQRIETINRIRADPGCIPHLKAYYKEQPWSFIDDFGMTFDPRLLRRGLPALIPFKLFPEQIEWIKWIHSLWVAGEDGLSDKSRDMGASWCFMSYASTMALFNDGYIAGVGSRKEILVDRDGDPDCLFYKARMFLKYVPHEFLFGFDLDSKAHNKNMMLLFPGTEAVIRGEAGPNIGRGGRASIYLVDESAFLTNQLAVDAALSQNTTCRIDLSSANGMDNIFAEKRHSGRVKVRTLHWSSDPRKDKAWHEREQARLHPIVFAQEVEIDYSASKEGIIIPQAWVLAAIDADEKLGIEINGRKLGALDIADEGPDVNAWSMRRGMKLEHIEQWSGKAGDIYKTVERSFRLCDEHGVTTERYDSDGMGVGARGDARKINEARREANRVAIEVVPFRGSAAVVRPEAWAVPEGDGHKGVKNKDFFANLKAQSWWHLRTLFYNTWRAVEEGAEYDPDQIIVLNGAMPELHALKRELSQPRWTTNEAGKMVILKTPLDDGKKTKSPNMADAVMMSYAPLQPATLTITDELLSRI